MKRVITPSRAMRLIAYLTMLAATVQTSGCADHNLATPPPLSTDRESFVEGGTEKTPLEENRGARPTIQPASGNGLVPALLLSGGHTDNSAFTRSEFSNNMSGFTFDTHFINTEGIPTRSQLQQYDVILLWENGLLPNTLGQEVGDVVAQYVGEGGGLVIGTFYWQQRSDGTIFNLFGWGENLESIDPFNTTTAAEYTHDTLEPSSIIAHPLTDGLATMSGFYHGGVVAKSATPVVAKWSDGVPLIGYSRDACIVGISHFPAHNAYGLVSGDFYQMWENALTFAAASCTESVAVLIDVKPDGEENVVSCNNAAGVIAVAVLTTAEFDALSVDHTTVSWSGARETHMDKKSGAPRRHEEDVDSDGDLDLVFHFRFGDSELGCSSTETLLTGETVDGTPIEGRDGVRMVGG